LDDKQSTVLVTYHVEGWTWQDLLKAFKDQRALIESVDRPVVDVLVDVRKSNFMPKANSLLGVIRNVSLDRHPRQGQTIVVGASMFIHSVANAMNRLSKAQLSFLFVKTMDEAQKMLDELAAKRQPAAATSV
jgi:hypothetical protein